MTRSAKRRLSVLAAILVLATISPRARAAEPANRLVIQADQVKDTISRNISGHFSGHLGHCIYEGIWVGEESPIPNTRGIRNDIVAALKRTKIPVLRWPGGCFADEYHWMDGIGPREKPLRDALVAGLTLNIFNRHCDRVRMANLAQTVNVLQAMILTDKAKILLTPTYHVFEMYSVHHDATLLPADLSCEDYDLGKDQIPALSASASRDKAGKIHVTLCNLNPNASAEVHCELQGRWAKSISGRVLTAGEMQAHNTFDAPETIKPSELREFTPRDDGFTALLPAKSVVVLELE